MAGGLENFSLQLKRANALDHLVFPRVTLGNEPSTDMDNRTTAWRGKPCIQGVGAMTRAAALENGRAWPSSTGAMLSDVHPGSFCGELAFVCETGAQVESLMSTHIRDAWLFL